MEIVEIEVVNFACVIFQVQGNGAYPLGFGDPPDTIDIFIVPHI